MRRSPTVIVSVIKTFFSVSELGYTQMPVSPLGLPHLAPDGHMKSARQTSAQYLSPDWSCNAHIGFASVPVGLSVGQLPDESHFGTHASPSTPWICASTSSDWHGGFS